MFFLGALVAACTFGTVFAAPAWGQNGGSRTRTGVSPSGWPTSGYELPEDQQSKPLGEQRVVRELGAPYPITYTTGVLQHERPLTSYPILTKTPCPVVLSASAGGYVVAALPAEAYDQANPTLPEIIVKLANPDLPASNWKLPFSSADSGQDKSTDPLSIDLVADNNDNTYLFVDDRNSLLSGVDGYVVSFDKLLNPNPWVAGQNFLNLKSNLRTINLYHISATMGGIPPPTIQDGSQRLFMGLGTLDSQRGLAIVSSNSGCLTDQPNCAFPSPTPGPIAPYCPPPPGSCPNPAPAGSQCCLLSPAVSPPPTSDVFAGVTGSAYLDKVGLVGLITYSLNKRGPALGAFKEDGSTAWVTDGSQGQQAINFIAHINQPNPTIDPNTGNIYWVGVLQTGEATQNRIYCATNSGAPCQGFGSSDNGNELNVQAAFNNVAGISLQWAFQLAIVPDGLLSSRLLLSFTTGWAGASTQASKNPTGCVATLSLKDGSMLDYYCIPRDMNSYFANTNYLATAPIVAKDARGVGAHTALVAQFDIIIFAFDPMNLQQGPLYAVDPFQDAGKEAASISTDYLALSAGGSVICQGWDDTKTEHTIFAIPGILKYAPTNGGTAPSSAGKTAATAIGVTFGLGIAIGVWVWWVGGVAVAGGILANLPGVSNVISLVKGRGGGGGGGFKASSATTTFTSSSSYGATGSPTHAGFSSM